MQERSASPPLGNILMFVVILVLALVVYPWLMREVLSAAAQGRQGAGRPRAQRRQSAGEKKADDDKKAADKAADEKKPEKEKDKPGDQAKARQGRKPRGRNGKRCRRQRGPQRPQPDSEPTNEPRQWVTLGSVDPDPKNPYRMLVTLSNEGASLARLELSSERYRDLEDRSGYLGHLVMDDSDKGPGCLVQVVGAGTPAAEAGVKPGDRILELVHQGQTTAIDGPAGLESALRQTKPGETVELVIQRGKDRLPNVEVNTDSPAAGSDSPRAEKAEHGLDLRRALRRHLAGRQLPAFALDHAPAG